MYVCACVSIVSAHALVLHLSFAFVAMRSAVDGSTLHIWMVTKQHFLAHVISFKWLMSTTYALKAVVAACNSSSKWLCMPA